MKEFKGRVAVVTGGASGIGRSLAGRFAREGMKVVLADIEDEPLERAVSEIKAAGGEAAAKKTDVSLADDVRSLADFTLETYGGVHLVCNNAGVGAGGLCWKQPLGDWEWVIGVNLWGVIHGVRTFVPIMLERGEEGHIVNTASMAGLISGPSLAIYNLTKHGVVALSESVYHELKMVRAKIGVSVLCPALVRTGIAEAERNRPDRHKSAAAVDVNPEGKMLDRMLAQFLKDGKGKDPDVVADNVFDAVRENRFYILTHPEWKDQIRKRMEEIIEERNPTYTPLV